MTPDTLEATAARYDRWYGAKPGDGGTSDQLRAGAQAMRRVSVLVADRDAACRMWQEAERLLEAVTDIDDTPQCCGHGVSDGYGPPECCGRPQYGLDRAMRLIREAKLAAYEETNDER